MPRRVLLVTLLALAGCAAPAEPARDLPADAPDTSMSWVRDAGFYDALEQARYETEYGAAWNKRTDGSRPPGPEPELTLEVPRFGLLRIHAMSHVAWRPETTTTSWTLEEGRWVCCGRVNVAVYGHGDVTWADQTGYWETGVSLRMVPAGVDGVVGMAQVDVDTGRHIRQYLVSLWLEEGASGLKQHVLVEETSCINPEDEWIFNCGSHPIPGELGHDIDHGEGQEPG